MRMLVPATGALTRGKRDILCFIDGVLADNRYILSLVSIGHLIKQCDFRRPDAVPRVEHAVVE